MEKTNEASKSRTKFFPNGCLRRIAWVTIPAHQTRALRKMHQIVLHPHASSKHITKHCSIRRCAISTNAASMHIHASSCFFTTRCFFPLRLLIRQVTRSVAAESAHNFPLDKVEKLGENEPLRQMVSTIGIHAANNGEKYVR